MKKIDRITLYFSIFGAVALAFLAGSISTYYQHFPYRWIDDAATAYRAEQEKEAYITKAEALPPPALKPQPVTQKSGAYGGYTLYTTMNRAVLIDADGKEVHVWGHDLSADGRKTIKDAAHSVLRYAKLVPNGDLLEIDETGGGVTPYGLGINELNGDSKILWSYGEHAHHTIELGDDGTIYVPIQKVRAMPDDVHLPGAPSEFLDCGIAHLDAHGKEIEKAYLFDIFMKSPYASYINFKSRQKRLNWDVFHVNSLNALSRDMAATFPMFRPGQVLISSRSLSMLAVIDLQAKKVVWATQGPWKFQHDAQFNRDGHIYLFDNVGGGPNHSRILKFNPAGNVTDVVYEGDEEHRFSSRIFGMQQLLPNGDIMITESNNGRIFEVDAKGQIVWEFFNPLVVKGKREAIMSAKRYSKDEIGFLK